MQTEPKFVETEVRYLDVDAKRLKQKLSEIGAKDCGLSSIDEIIYYDEALTWSGEGKFIRVRKINDEIFLTYKKHPKISSPYATEIEMKVDNWDGIQAFLSQLKLIPFRHQQKRRHKFTYQEIQIDIDTWPKIPTYVELEGKNVEALMKLANILELDQKNLTHDDPKTIIENKYFIPVTKLRKFTFKEVA